jgi:CubicO group peptidase (beta-lactamase class C family)
MMSRISFILALSAARLAAQAPAPPAEIDAYVARAVKEWGLPGVAIAVVRNDSVLFATGYGVREIGRPETVDAHTTFDAASLTKSFTAAALATLVDEGKLHWDDQVRRYIPELVLPDSYMTANTTIRDLLAHRTGLQGANFMWRFTGYDRAEVLRRVRYLKPEIPFRTGMVYSNVSYTIAGEAAARIAGTTWEALVRIRLLEPVGMTETYFWDERGARGKNAAAAHILVDDVQRAIDPVDGAAEHDGRVVTNAAGSVQSSVTDLAKWMRFQLGDGTFGGARIISTAAMEEMHSPQVVVPTPAGFRRARQVDFFATYGMGWQVWDYRGHPMLWHTGGGNGMLAYMALLPKEKFGVVVLVNSWRGAIVHATIANRILDHYLNAPTRDYSHEQLVADSAARKRGHEAYEKFLTTRTTNARPARALRDYAGTYVDTLHGDITLRLAGDSMLLRMGRGATADLESWTADAFLVKWRNPVYREDYWNALAEFTYDKAGEPAAFTMRLNRDTLRAIRVKR